MAATPHARKRFAQPLDPSQFSPCFAMRPSLRGLPPSLHCEDVDLRDIAARVGTPAYVYSRAAIEAAYQRLDRALAGIPHTICYAVKANSTLGVLRVLARLGASFDIVSGGELDRLLRIGVSPRRMVFSGVGKTREELREALKRGIFMINVESAAELDLLVHEASRLRRCARAAIRVNPDVEAGGHPHISTGRHHHKFGVDWAEARALYLAFKDSRWIDWQGISAHIGSQILSAAPYRRAVSRLASYVRDLRGNGIRLRYVDAGGGLGIRYTEEEPLDMVAYARVLKNAIRPLGCRLLIEPGRSIVGAAGVLLMEVLYTKSVGGKKHFVIVDAAMNDMMRPTLYGATHPITHVERRFVGAQPAAPARNIRADIVGPVCESGDCFLEDWPIEECLPGDLLALWGAGAYGSVLSSNYNSRPRAAEVLVEGRRFRVIRRRESRRDLTQGE